MTTTYSLSIGTILQGSSYMEMPVFRNKKILLILLMIFASPNILWAQEYIITEVKELKQDLSARTNPRVDLNGELCSIIKISSPDIVKSVEGSMVVGEISKTSAYTLAYIPKESKSIRIVFTDNTNQLITFSDWGINKIPPGGCFEITISNITDMNDYALLSKAKRLYEKGLYKLSLPLLSKLSQKSENEEMRTVGLLLMAKYYQEVEKNMIKAYEVFQKMPEGEKKYLCIGTLKCTEKKYKESIDYLKKAEQYGSKKGILLLFKIYKGEIPSDFTDKTQAYKYGMKIAALGEADAQHFVACCYLGAIGVEYNVDEAITYLTMAASQGKVESQRMLGAIYLMDNKRDVPTARRWLKMAANQKDKEAISLLNQIGWE